jgi:uncharacterized protein
MQIQVRKLTAAEMDEIGVRQWPVWEKEESVFDWDYDEPEQCLFLDGEVEITPSKGPKVKIQKGDFVVFPRGLHCQWHVLKRVRKHYRFG